jgi:hypothetical protein
MQNRRIINELLRGAGARRSRRQINSMIVLFAHVQTLGKCDASEAPRRSGDRDHPRHSIVRPGHAPSGSWFTREP